MENLKVGIDERELFSQTFYKTATLLFETSKTKIENMVADSVMKKSVIAQEANEASQRIQEVLLNGREELKETIEKVQAEIERKYQIKASYMDDAGSPNQAQIAAEALRRQDFDMKLELMDEREVAELVHKYTNPETTPLSEYEYNAIKLWIKRNAKSSDNYNLDRDLAQIAQRTNIGQEWLNDPEYVKNENLLVQLRSMGIPTMLWLKQEDGTYTPLDVSSELEDVIKGYA